MESALKAPAKASGKRARTRKALIHAALAVVREQGFANVTMEAVAARAGVSRGSIYGNFRDRNDLLVAVALDRAPPISPGHMPGATVREQLRAMGRAVAEAARKRRPDGVYRAAYLVNVLADETLRRRVVAQDREIRRRVLEIWQTMPYPAESLPLPADQFLRIIGALTDGLLIAHWQSPEDFDEALIVTAYEALAGPPEPRSRAEKSRGPTTGNSTRRAT
jgi:AcrR family transcriptional regulator